MSSNVDACARQKRNYLSQVLATILQVPRPSEEERSVSLLENFQDLLDVVLDDERKFRTAYTCHWLHR